MNAIPPAGRTGLLAFGLGAYALLGLGACGASGGETGLGDDAASDGTGQSRQAIVGGETDSEHTAVLAIATITEDSQGLCTGTLIAPNLVLTARHCVVPSETELVVCAESTFAAPYGPNNLWVSASTDISGSRLFPVREVQVPIDDGALCGADIALLILNGQFSERISPLAPRLDTPAERGESFTAIGFGSALEEGSAGVRRNLAGLEVVCGPEDCETPEVLTTTEFIGEQAVCEGDSGGPALDRDGQIVGVASRTGQGCGWAVYSAVPPWRDWILEVAERAAELGEYDSPPWLTSALSAGSVIERLPEVLPESDLGTSASASGDGEVVPPSGIESGNMGSAASARAGSGCSMPANGAGSARGLSLGALALALVTYRRRRRVSV